LTDLRFPSLFNNKTRPQTPISGIFVSIHWKPWQQP
jgi:hypothetical protein